LDFLAEIAATSADVTPLQIGPQRMILLKHPDMVQQLLVGDGERTEKGRTAERDLFFSFLGQGLLNARGEAHRRQRRMILPGFHRARLKTYADAMTRTAARHAEAWQSGDVRDMNAEMMELALANVTGTLISTDVSASADAITSGFDVLTRNVNRMMFPGARWLLRTPLPFARRVERSREGLDAAVYRLIAMRRAQAHDTGDILSMLLSAEDADHPGERLSDVEVRDEIMTLLFTGQGPIGNTLSWTWWLLAQHEDAQNSLHAELDTVLGSRNPVFDDIPKLVLTEQIIRESLRLYPSIWAMGRRATAELDYSGVKVPAGTLLVASQWITQRDERWYEDPLAFRPARWTPAFKSNLPRFAYFPFGGGQRGCIGENYAWMQLVLVVATFARRWRFEMTARARDVQPQARITVHPDRAMPLQIRTRTN
jgi:cytochrome P450